MIINNIHNTNIIIQIQNNQHTHHSAPGYIHSTMLPKLKCPNKMENPQNQTKKKAAKGSQSQTPQNKTGTGSCPTGTEVIEHLKQSRNRKLCNITPTINLTFKFIYFQLPQSAVSSKHNFVIGLLYVPLLVFIITDLTIPP